MIDAAVRRRRRADRRLRAVRLHRRGCRPVRRRRRDEPDGGAGRATQHRTGGAHRDGRPGTPRRSDHRGVDRRPSLRGAGIRRISGGVEPRPRRAHRHVRRLVGRLHRACRWRSSGPTACASGGPRGQPPRRVAVSPGAGESRIAAAAAAGCDVLVSGDISHHRVVEASDRGLSIIDVGHAASERPGMARLESLVAEICAGDPSVSWRDRRQQRRHGDQESRGRVSRVTRGRQLPCP